MVLRLGVSPDRIVFANACKRPRDIRAAANKQVGSNCYNMYSVYPASSCLSPMSGCIAVCMLSEYAVGIAGKDCPSSSGKSGAGTCVTRTFTLTMLHMPAS